MMDKIISIDLDDGPYQMILSRVLRMVPDKDRHDVDLKRLLAFRIRTDGEGATREYLIYKIRDMVQCAYTGRLYDFLKDDKASSECLPEDELPEPPDIA